MRRYRQSLYPVVFRAVQALLCGFTVYVVLSAMFYGSLFMVCGGEMFAATAFSVALCALVFSIGMIDDLHKDIYTHAESIAFSAYGRVPALSSFIHKEKVLRVSYSAGLIKRLFKTRKLVIVTQTRREVLYVKEKDFAAVCTCLPEPFANNVMKMDKAETRAEAGKPYAFSVTEGLRLSLKIFVYGLAVLIAVYPVAMGIFLGNGVSLKASFPNLSLVGAVSVVFAIALGGLFSLSLLVGGLKLLLLALPYANYRIRREGKLLLVSYGRIGTRVHALRVDRLRAVCRSYFSLLPSLTAVKLFFAEGKKRLVLSVAQRALSKEESGQISAMLPAFEEGGLKPYAFGRNLPTLVAYAVFAILPTTVFAALESWLILCLYLPFVLLFFRTVQVRAVGETERAITCRKGVLGVSQTTVLKKDISAVKLSAGVFARPFKRVNAQIYLKHTETAIEIPCLTREEGEKALFLVKHTKK